MYRNDLYSNTSDSSRNGGGSWVYINGEFYHAGVKGMHWYQHLPGTDWWKNVGKATKNTYGQAKSAGETKGSALKIAAKTGARMIGGRIHGYLANESRYYRNKASNAINNARTNITTQRNRINNRISVNTQDRYLSNKRHMESIGNKPMTHIEKYMQKQLRDGEAMYNKLTTGSKNKGLDTLNLAIQNAQFNIVKGLNDFLGKRGLTEKVDNLISKFIGKSELGKARDAYNERQASKAEKEAKRNQEKAAKEAERKREENRKKAIQRANRSTSANNDRRANTRSGYSTSSPKRVAVLTSNNVRYKYS